MPSVANLTAHLAALVDELTEDLAAKEKKLRELNEERGPFLDYVRDYGNSSKRTAITQLEESRKKLSEAQVVVDKERDSIRKNETALAGVNIVQFKKEYDEKQYRNSNLYYEIERLNKTIEKTASALKDETIKAATGAAALALLERAETELAALVQQNKDRAMARNGISDSQREDTGDWGLPEKVKQARERVRVLRETIGLPPLESHLDAQAGDAAGRMSNLFW